MSRSFEVCSCQANYCQNIIEFTYLVLDSQIPFQSQLVSTSSLVFQELFVLIKYLVIELTLLTYDYLFFKKCFKNALKRYL